MKKDTSSAKSTRPTNPPVALTATGGEADEIQFELTFVGGDDPGDDTIRAELSSRLLDPLLQSNGVLPVNVHTLAAGKKGKVRFLLDNFHVASLMEFLRGQWLVRATLEAELARDRENWSTKRSTGGGDVWRSVRVLSLDLVRRRVPSAQFLERMRERMEPERYAKFVAAQDTPSTRSVFILAFECKWDDEHHVKVEFRDGQFTALSHE